MLTAKSERKAKTARLAALERLNAEASQECKERLKAIREQYEQRLGQHPEEIPASPWS